MLKARCSVEGCTLFVKCKDLCGTHYERARKGKPVDGAIRRYTQQDMDLLASGRRFCGACRQVKPLDEFYARKAVCKECRNAQRRAWREANPEMWSRQGKRYRETHPELVAERKREWNQRDPLARRAQRLAVRYNLTPEDFNALIAEQDGRCAICRTEEPGGRHGVWHVDHCHDSMRVRGLLCDACNRGIGFLRHDIALMASAIAYLSKS